MVTRRGWLDRVAGLLMSARGQQPSSLATRRRLGRLRHTLGCTPLGVSEQTYYRWRNQFGGLKADDAKRLKDLERENSTLKRLLADAELEKAALKEIASGNF